MSSMNKAILMGNLGRDPEVKQLNQQTKVANFPIATQESWKDKQGEKQERTEWHQIDVFGKQAEMVEKYLQKGDSVLVEGKMQTDSWEDKEGNKKQRTKVRGLSVTFVSLKGKKEPQSEGEEEEKPF